MDWVKVEAFGLLEPGFANELIGRQHHATRLTGDDRSITGSAPLRLRGSETQSQDKQSIGPLASLHMQKPTPLTRRGLHFRDVQPLKDEIILFQDDPII